MGPYNLIDVDKYLKEGIMGAYILSRGDDVAHYVGRSNNLRVRLNTHQQESPEYIQFWYYPTSSALEAYYKECELYHKYNPSDNDVHPAIPPDSAWKCPISGCPWSA